MPPEAEPTRGSAERMPMCRESGGASPTASSASTSTRTHTASRPQTPPARGPLSSPRWRQSTSWRWRATSRTCTTSFRPPGPRVRGLDAARTSACTRGRASASSRGSSRPATARPWCPWSTSSTTTPRLPEYRGGGTPRGRLWWSPRTARTSRARNSAARTARDPTCCCIAPTASPTRRTWNPLGRSSCGRRRCGRFARSSFPAACWSRSCSTPPTWRTACARPSTPPPPTAGTPSSSCGL
mmetsp:Transcript_37968/g.101742  ORF Transcript_37968/g.101742 Transcript_37968/m.101742 type:complete len:241 (-) Transcript_37968:529-1251(-)